MKALLAPALLAVALPAQAVLIDFTSTEWAGVNGEETYTNDVAGIGDVTLRANVGTFTFNGNEGPGAIGGLGVGFV
ncbi:MAG: hypothetical protein MK096_03895 [Oleiphilaceae bacterium]|uniref:hypothetical protein n=1 Tax=Oleiphilus sp. HI0125 TaxID=1822266 RepID=UPI0007C2A761|nr:hypothetical protein [Oleiphilus sp. HI0125]KZZ57856.1 hypothetical protein A3762_08875 [Oleiphilus sp. HI0125]MCH2157903.1 hypothetical protein [Oleiphilaceae bacterium]